MAPILQGMGQSIDRIMIYVFCYTRPTASELDVLEYMRMGRAARVLIVGTISENNSEDLYITVTS